MTSPTIISGMGAILEALREAHPTVYLHRSDLPKPWLPSSILKAIVLGTDPSTPERRSLNVVFALDEETTYFTNVLKNLHKLGLQLENIYVQNVCKNYFTVEAPYNDHWESIARTYWAVPLRRELDDLDPTGRIPVFATAELVVRALVHEPEKIKSAEDVYEDELLFGPEENLLGRTMIPLFRHYAYSLDDWPEYADVMRKELERLQVDK